MKLGRPSWVIIVLLRLINHIDVEAVELFCYHRASSLRLIYVTYPFYVTNEEAKKGTRRSREFAPLSRLLPKASTLRSTARFELTR